MIYRQAFLAVRGCTTRLLRATRGMTDFNHLSGGLLYRVMSGVTHQRVRKRGAVLDDVIVNLGGHYASDTPSWKPTPASPVPDPHGGLGPAGDDRAGG